MARPTRTVPVALPADAPAATPWFRRVQVSGFTVTVLLLIVAALVVLAPSLKVLVEQQAEIAELERQVAEQQRVVDELQTDIDRWQDPAYIEAQARDRLLYVYPGDITYLVVDDIGLSDVDAAPAVSDEIQSTRIDWNLALLASAMTAGLTDLPAEQLISPQFGGEQ